MAPGALRGYLGSRSGPALAFGLGAVAATGQAPIGWAWLAVAAYAAILALASQVGSWRMAAWRGWAFGAGHFAVALAWIIEPFLVDPVRHGWMSPFALFFMAGGLALFWALAFGLAAGFGRTPHQRAAWLVVTWSGVELLRAFILTGFPWVMPGHIWIGAPQMQLAALVGAHGLTLLTLTAAAIPALVGPRRLLLGGLVGVALLSVPVAWARLRVPPGPALAADPAVTLRLVQPNAAQHLKWDPAAVHVFYERQLEFTGAPSAGGNPPDIVIWPETAIPWLLEHADPALRQMAEVAGEATVVTGVQRREGGRWFNSLVVLGPEGVPVAVYDKHRLVPFGEYMPFAEVFARLGVFGLATLASGGYAAGPGPRLLDMGGAGAALPLICYEAIFPSDIFRVEERPDWLLQVTNDAWFGQVAGPYQHLALARLRAVEQGLPLARAANTGVSAVFDPYGRSVASLPLGTAGYVDALLPAPLPATFYARYGNASVLFLLAGAALALAVRRRSITAA